MPLPRCGAEAVGWCFSPGGRTLLPSPLDYAVRLSLMILPLGRGAADLLAALQSGGGLLLVPTDDALLAALANSTDATGECGEEGDRVAVLECDAPGCRSLSPPSFPNLEILLFLPAAGEWTSDSVLLKLLLARHVVLTADQAVSAVGAGTSHALFWEGVLPGGQKTLAWRRSRYHAPLPRLCRACPPSSRCPAPPAPPR